MGLGEPLDVVPHVPHRSHLLVHGLEVEGDGLVLTLDRVGVHLDDVHGGVLARGDTDGVDDAGERDLSQLRRV